MRYLNIIATLVLTGFAMNALADGCFEMGFLNTPDGDGIVTALSGKRVDATGPGGDSPWNEDHCPTTVNTPGDLYKVGVSPTDPVDPRAFRGTWIAGTLNPGTGAGASGCPPGQVPGPRTGTGPPVCLTPVGQAQGTVQYNYTVGGSSSFSWTLYTNESGGICWENPVDGEIVATAPPPTPADPCDPP
jgi:hypothetical protein